MLGWSLFGSNLYKVLFYRQTVDRAEQMCADLSARLVQVDSVEENKFLYTMLDINRDIYPNSEYWVGNKVATTGVHDWEDGEPDTHDCVALGRTDTGDWKWKGVDCGLQQSSYFICQKTVTTESGNWDWVGTKIKISVTR